MSMREKTLAQLQAWAAAAAALLAGSGRRIVRELSLVVDLAGWRGAATWRDRLGSVSWVRVGAAGAGVAAIAGGAFFYAATRPIAYPPPDRTARQIALYEAAAKSVTAAPPPGLVAANQPVKPE